MVSPLMALGLFVIKKARWDVVKVVILVTTPCAPDHLNTRPYSEGEEYEIGSELMPAWLAEALVAGGQAEQVLQRQKESDVVDMGKEKPVSKPPGPSEVKEPKSQIVRRATQKGTGK